MNTTSKVFAVLATVVVVGGGALYLSTSSAPGPVADTSETFAPQAAPSPSSSASLALAAIDEVTASIQSDLNAQSSAIGALDTSADQTVSVVDTANSSKQPYDESSI